MPDKKLIDNEIKQALECCMHDDYDYCEKCPYRKNKPCQENLIQDAFDLTNRLQAENERLQSILLSFTSEVETWSNKKGYDTTELSLIAILDEATNIKAEIKSEAYKEFAKMLDNKAMFSQEINDDYAVGLTTINNLLKELVGEDK